MFYVQRAAVNKDSCNRARRARSLGYFLVIIIASYLICRYNCMMMSQVTVTSIANCDVITIAYKC